MSLAAYASETNMGSYDITATPIGRKMCDGELEKLHISKLNIFTLRRLNFTDFNDQDRYSHFG